MKNNKNKDLLNEIRELQERLKNLELSEAKRVLAEDQLQISETRYRRLFETIKDGILILDAETGTITDVNTVLIDMLGYSHEDYLGKKLWEIDPFKHNRASKTAFDELKFKKYIRYEALPVDTKDGRHIDVEFVCNAYPVNHKKVIQCNICDVTKCTAAEGMVKTSACKGLESELERLNAEAENSLEWILGRSDKMREIIEQLRRISKTDFTVLIQGETGVGKSFIANIIHNLSPRAHNPFIRIDMGTIPETLFESELFGYEKGAFTGADKKRKGLFELAANGGTIFIDELENMTPYAQSKFLTVIEEKKIHPLGSAETKDINVRFISATNRDIKQSLAEKRIRKDLFYRLSEFMITIPPLRERVDDIPFLAQKFLIEAEDKLNVPLKNFSEEIFEALKRYPWPGNVRELRNIIVRRAVLMSQNHSIKLRDIEFLLEDSTGMAESFDLLPLKELTTIAVRDVEKKAIKKALDLTKGNKSKAALILQVDYKTLLTKVKEYKLS